MALVTGRSSTLPVRSIWELEKRTTTIEFYVVVSDRVANVALSQHRSLWAFTKEDVALLRQCLDLGDVRCHNPAECIDILCVVYLFCSECRSCCGRVQQGPGFV